MTPPDPPHAASPHPAAGAPPPDLSGAQAEEQARRLELALWGGELGTCEWDLEQGAAKYDERFLALLGYEREPLAPILEAWEALIHPDDLGEVMWRLEAHLAGKTETLELEHRLRAGDGSWRRVALRARPITRDPQTGAPRRVLGVIRLREQAPPASGAAEGDAGRVAQLEAIGRLAGGVAHDFNNMLSVINGYAELALDRLEGDHPARRAIERIKAAGEKSAALTAKLLAFGGKQLLSPRVIEVRDLLDDLEVYLAPHLPPEVELVVTRSADLGRVRVDPGRLEQALLGLALNAREAMPQGGRLTLEARDLELAEEEARARATPAGPYVRLRLQDTGCGMDSETLQHLFEPFFSTKGHARGAGLGLPSVHGFVRQSGGAIEVTSRPGEGSTFSLYLPRVEEPAAASSGLIATRFGGDELVLLVEDEDLVRELARETLSGFGYQVIATRDGLEALAAVEVHPEVALVVSDVVMPNLGGLELAAELQRRRPDLPVLLVSGYTRDVARVAAEQALGQVVLSKPVPPALLARVVRLLIDGRHAEALELVGGARPSG